MGVDTKLFCILAVETISLELSLKHCENMITVLFKTVCVCVCAGKGPEDSW